MGASKLANAVLRRLIASATRSSFKISDAVDALALEGSHPRWLVARWITRWGLDETRRLLDANNREAPLSRDPSTSCGTTEAMFETAGVTSRRTTRPRQHRARERRVVAHGVGAVPPGTLSSPGPGLDARRAVRPRAHRRGRSRRARHPVANPSSLAARRRRVRERPFARAIAAVVENAERLEIDTLHSYVADARFPAIRSVDLVLVDAPCTGTERSVATLMRAGASRSPISR
jgi:16S rRNA (cytosine967-C5)-methyltransferase